MRGCLPLLPDLRIWRRPYGPPTAQGGRTGTVCGPIVVGVGVKDPVLATRANCRACRGVSRGPMS